MNKPKHDTIGVDALITHNLGNDETNPVAELTVQVIHMLESGLSELRNHDTAPDMESVMITALVTYAGCLHGEMLGLGLVPDLSGKAVTKLLETNFRSGVRAGKRKVERLQVEHAEAERAASGQVPS